MRVVLSYARSHTRALIRARSNAPPHARPRGDGEPSFLARASRARNAPPGRILLRNQPFLLLPGARYTLHSRAAASHPTPRLRRAVPAYLLLAVAQGYDSSSLLAWRALRRARCERYIVLPVVCSDLATYSRDVRFGLGRRGGRSILTGCSPVPEGSAPTARPWLGVPDARTTSAADRRALCTGPGHPETVRPHLRG
jgi:hypothetical protein